MISGKEKEREREKRRKRENDGGWRERKRERFIRGDERSGFPRDGQKGRREGGRGRSAGPWAGCP